MDPTELAYVSKIHCHNTEDATVLMLVLLTAGGKNIAM
jgi:hypothetical protein